MKFPLDKNDFDLDSKGFQVLVHKAIKTLNTKNKDPFYLFFPQDRNSEMPINGVNVINGEGQSAHAVFEFADENTANRVLVFLLAAIPDFKNLLKKLDMNSSEKNWARKISLKTDSDEIVKKEPPVNEKLDEVPLVKSEVVTVNLEEAKTREHQTLLKSIRDALKGVMPEEELAKQNVLKKYAGRNDSAEIVIADETIMAKSLYILEKQGFAVTMLGATLIASKDTDLIATIPHHITIANELEKCTEWFAKVAVWFEREHVNAWIVCHPLQVVRNNFEYEIPIQAESHYVARLVLQFFEGNKIPAKKRGKMVYVTASKIVIKKQLVDVILKRDSFESESETEFAKGTFDYEQFHFLPFNRDRDDNHTEWIAQSMDEFGIIDIIKVAYTDCVDGEWKLWIVDGQHTYSAAKKRNLKVWYVQIRVDSLEELVRLTAVLNNRRKLWKFKDYLKAWSEINVPVYRKVADWVAKKLPFSVIIEAISGKNRRQANPLFQDGVFTEDESLHSDEILNYMLVLRPFLPKAQTVSSAVLRFMWSEKNYNNARMAAVLKKSKDRGDILFEVGESTQAVVNNIKKLYDSQTAF